MRVKCKVLFTSFFFIMFNSAMIASLEDVAQALEVTCDQVINYMQTKHWEIACEHGATKNTTDITICMEDWLEQPEKFA